MQLNKDLIAYNFSNKSLHYHKNAKIQKLVAQKLCQFLIKNLSHKNLSQWHKINILDLGSGSSFIAQNLFQQQLNCDIFEIDLSLQMLQNYYHQFDDNNQTNVESIKSNLPKINNHFKICGDIENLPFNHQVFDVIIASFSLQWLANYQKLFGDIKNYLKKSGVFALSIPDDRSFGDLKDSPLQLLPMPKHEIILKAFGDNNFKQIFYYHEMIVEPYNNPIEALKSFKEIGVNYNITDNQQQDLKKLSKIRKFYLKNCQNQIDYKLDWSVSYYLFSI